MSVKDREDLRAAHANERKLAESALATGVAARIEVCRVQSTSGSMFGSPYHLYDLSPAWATRFDGQDGRMSLPTACEVVFYLNNGRDVRGWYTVEEIDAWIAGGGRIVEEASERAKAGRRA